MSPGPAFEYEVPFVTTAHWYMTHGYSAEETAALLEMRFPFASAAARDRAIGWALRSRQFEARAESLLPFERMGALFFGSGLAVPVVGVRILVKIAVAPGLTEDASVTINVPPDWTYNQMLNAVDDYVRQGQIPRRRGRHYEGEVVGYQLFGVTGLAFEDPALDLMG